ncbi:MAG: hypothetical protein PHO67_07020 [Candidatus Omnitrophica bacterium]|nr:hypothetical protein [Candidatus Omnitrophota bacterium]
MNIWKTFLKWVDEKHLQVQFALTVVTLFLAIATFLMAGFMFWQARILRNSVLAQKDSVDIQIKELSLGKRPYIYVEIENVSIKPRIEVDTKTGKISTYYMVIAEVKFKNEGIIPAVVTKVSYFVTTSADKRNLDTPKYFIDNLGSYPYPTIVFPKQENLKFNYGADCSSVAERIYFNVVIAYEGYREKENATTKTYWYSFTSKYASIGTPTIQKIPLPDGKEDQVSIIAFQIIKLEMKGDWDRDTDFDIPNVYEPNWTVEEEQLIKQRKFLK